MLLQGRSQDFSKGGGGGGSPSGDRRLYMVLQLLSLVYVKKQILKKWAFQQWLLLRFRHLNIVGCLLKTGADPRFFLGGGALVSCCTSTPTNHIVFFLQNTSCIRKPQVISGGEGGGGAHPLHPPPKSAPAKEGLPRGGGVVTGTPGPPL